MIKGKTAEEIRKTFNIKNDFTPAEEEQVNPLNQLLKLKFKHAILNLKHLFYQIEPFMD